MLTSAISWRAVLAVNAPLAIVCVLVTLKSVPADEPRTGTGLVFGFADPGVGWGLTRRDRAVDRERCRRWAFVASSLIAVVGFVAVAARPASTPRRRPRCEVEASTSA